MPRDDPCESNDYLENHTDNLLVFRLWLFDPPSLTLFQKHWKILRTRYKYLCAFLSWIFHQHKYCFCCQPSSSVAITILLVWQFSFTCSLLLHKIISRRTGLPPTSNTTLLHYFCYHESRSSVLPCLLGRFRTTVGQPCHITRGAWNTLSHYSSPYLFLRISPQNLPLLFPLLLFNTCEGFRHCLGDYYTACVKLIIARMGDPLSNFHMQA
jgi:hypothetical protein